MDTPEAAGADGASGRLATLDHNALLEAAVEHSLDFTAVADTEGRFVFASKAHGRFGFEPERFIGSSVFEVIHPDDREEARARFAEVVSTGDPRTAEYRACRPDGECAWVETHACPITLGAERYVICTTRSVHHRKLAAERLREGEAFLRSIIDNTFDLVALTDTEGTLTFLGKSHELIGYQPNELLGTNAFELMHLDQREQVRRRFRRMVETGEPDRVEHQYRTTDGGWVWLETVGRVIEHRGELRVLLNSRDISERKHAEHLDKQRIAEQAVLLTEVHHRIKNNMSTVAGLLSLQAESMSSPEAAEALEEARGRLQAMQTLYENLYRSDNLRRMSIRSYLEPLIEDIVAVFAGRVRISLEKEIADIELDPKKLSTLGIITNELVTNALKHAFAGRHCGTLSVSAQPSGDRLIFTITDDGSGMNACTDDEHVSSFGWSLIRILSEHIGATVTLGPTENSPSGTRVVLSVPL